MDINNRDAFRMDVDSADIYKDQEVAEEDITSWDDIFRGFFEEPLKEPKNTVLAVRRSLPPYHHHNFTGGDFHIPHFFTTDDMYGERWAFLLTSLGDRNMDWTFLAFKPDRLALLEFLAGKQDLNYVYEHTKEDQFFLVRPNVSDHLIQIDPYSEMPQTAMAEAGALYNDNIFLDMDDPEYGYNSADAAQVMRHAKAGRFFYGH